MVSNKKIELRYLWEHGSEKNTRINNLLVE